MPPTHKKKRPVRRAVLRALWRHAPGAMLRLRDLGGCTRLKRDARFLDLYRTIYDEGRARMSIRELYNLYAWGQRAAALPAGDFAEVGVYRGGSAKMLCEVKGARRLWLFDTFEGMPASDRAIDEFGPGDFVDTSVAGVEAYLARYPNLTLVPGYFPASLEGTEAPAARFAFVNLDVDLYRSTLDALAFFYPRLVPGGVLISHDYLDLIAVETAFTEYFADKPEPVIALFDTQCLVVKAHQSDASNHT